MKNNFFKLALENNDEAYFFRGLDKYFVPSRDYEGHVHGANMGGCARVYAEESTEHSAAFDKAFLIFLDSLDVSKEDLNHLLANLSSYCAQKSRGGFPESHLFDNADEKGWIFLKGYLNKVWRASFCDEVKEQINRHANFINKKGFSFAIDIISTFKVEK